MDFCSGFGAIWIESKKLNTIAYQHIFICAKLRRFFTAYSKFKVGDCGNKKLFILLCYFK